MTINVSAAVAKWVSNLTYEALPVAVVEQSKRCLLDTLGVAVGGCTHDVVSIAEEFVTTVAPKDAPATILVSGKKASVPGTAFVNGVLSHELDFDDTHLGTSIHPSGPVLAASLAVGEWLGSSGQELILAHVVGVEAECCVGAMVSPSHYAMGWHSTGTLGVLGAAMASARLLRLSFEETRVAIGVALAQSAGFREAFGTMVKAFHIGKAAENGVAAALLASKGFTGPSDPIGGRRGFASVFASSLDTSLVTSLGSDWQILRDSFKPYACGVVIHPSIDGALELKGKYGFEPEEIEEIKLKVHPHVLDLTGKTSPETGLEGKFSVYHAVAIALFENVAGEREFSDASVRRPEVVALRQRVHTEVDAGLNRNQSAVNITLKSGREYTTTIHAAKGTPENPMSNEELEQKFLALVVPVLGEDRAERVLRAVSNLNRVRSVSELTRDLAHGVSDASGLLSV